MVSIYVMSFISVLIRVGNKLRSVDLQIPFFKCLLNYDAFIYQMLSTIQSLF
uniref:Uncharacterized protein n=1 Tax=Anguilla anguilla TaxID=7936 RepID=A0A0E9TAB8_ANGAN